MLIKPPAIRSALDINESYFRKYAFSVFTGVSFKRSQNFNWSISINQSLVSIVKPEFKEEIELISEEYNVYVYPVELLVSIAYIIN